MTRATPVVTSLAALVLTLLPGTPAVADTPDPDGSDVPSRAVAPDPPEDLPVRTLEEDPEVFAEGEPAPEVEEAELVTRPDLMVLGDSLSVLAAENRGVGYVREANDPAHPQAWWAHVALDAGVDPTDPARVDVDAISDTGMIHGGLTCADSFASRLDRISQKRPHTLLVAAGRNDFKQCEDDVFDPTLRRTDESLEEGFSAYLAELGRRVDRIPGLGRERTYVMAPWGSKFIREHAQVVPILERVATRHGFTFIHTPTVPDRLTRMTSTGVDRTHPDAAGTRWLAHQVRMGSDIVDAIARRPAAPVSAGVRVVCGATTWCTAKKYSDSGYRDARRTSFWGRPAGSDATNYAAYWLSRGTARLPLRDAAEPRTWNAAALASRGRASIAAAPRPGDIAWWDEAPPGVTGTGHVAIVDKVVNTYTIQVTETTGRGGWYRTTRYSSKALPRAYLRLARGDGSPDGVLKSLEAVSRTKLKIRGIATETDAFDRGTQLQVVVQQGSRTIRSSRLAATRWGFSRTVTLTGLRKGAATVWVRALNASGTKGRSYVNLHKGPLTIP